MVEELLPALVAFVPQVDMNKWIVLRFDWFFYQLHAGVFRSPASLFNVAGCARTDNIFPDCFAAQHPRDNMIKRQLAGWKTLAAVLAAVFVAGEDISTVKFHLVTRQSVEKQKPDNPRHRNMEIHRRDPIVPVRLEIALELAHLAPALEIIIGISALLE